MGGGAACAVCAAMHVATVTPTAEVADLQSLYSIPIHSLSHPSLLAAIELAPAPRTICCEVLGARFCTCACLAPRGAVGNMVCDKCTKKLTKVREVGVPTHRCAAASHHDALNYQHAC